MLKLVKNKKGQRKVNISATLNLDIRPQYNISGKVL